MADNSQETVTKIRTYPTDLLDYLDGGGLIVTDDDLISDELDNIELFNKLREICKGG